MELKKSTENAAKEMLNHCEASLSERHTAKNCH